MKYWFFSLLLGMLPTIGAVAQTYYSLSDVRGDTVAFLQKNFIQQQSCFQGKSIRTLAPYFEELRVLEVISLDTSIHIDPEGRSYIEGLLLCFYSEADLKSKWVRGERPVRLWIYVQKPWVDCYEFWRSGPDDTKYDWEYCLKHDFIIDRMEIIPYFYV